MNTKIKEIIMEILEVELDQISDDASIVDDLGADSIAIMEIVMELETEYDVEIDTQEIVKFKTVSDIQAYLENK